MTREDKKRKLEHYRYILLDLEDLSDRYAIEFAKATRVVSSSDGMPHGNEMTSKVERESAKLADIRRKIEKRMVDKLTIENAVARLPFTERQYVEFISLKGYSIQQASREFHRGYDAVKKGYYRGIDRLVL